MKGKILVIGANGQLGSVLVHALQKKHRIENVVGADLTSAIKFHGIFEVLDATKRDQLQNVVEKYQIKEIYHLAAILSAKGEEDPIHTWQVNMTTLFNVLEVSRMSGVKKIFFPSSIAVFGDAAPLEQTSNNTFLNPATVYGISKASGECWAQYYHLRYGIDIRSIRYPGVIGYQSMPGGGTTDYAVSIFHKAVLGEHFDCFLSEDTVLPMIFMDDVIRATIELMDAPESSIKTRTAYNIAGVSFSPSQVVSEIHKFYPDFSVRYTPDFRQEIAMSWPKTIDDSVARKEWGWQSRFDLQSITELMIQRLRNKYSKGSKHLEVLLF